MHYCSTCITNQSTKPSSCFRQRSFTKRREVHLDVAPPSTEIQVATVSLWNFDTMNTSTSSSTPGMLQRAAGAAAGAVGVVSRLLSASRSPAPTIATAPPTITKMAAEDVHPTPHHRSSDQHNDGQEGRHNTPSSPTTADQLLRDHQSSVTGKIVDLARALQGSEGSHEPEETLNTSSPLGDDMHGYDIASTQSTTAPSAQSVAVDKSILEEVRTKLFASPGRKEERVLPMGEVGMTPAEVTRHVNQIIHALTTNKEYRSNISKHLVALRDSKTLTLGKPQVPDGLKVLNLTENDLTLTMKAQLTVTMWLRDMFSVAGETLSNLMAGLVDPRIPTQCSHSDTGYII